MDRTRDHISRTCAGALKAFLIQSSSGGATIPSEHQSHRWVSAILARRSGANPDAVQVADATIAIWFDFATALQSIIGLQGVAALYDRSVSLTARTYPWLVPWRSHDDHSVDLDALQSVIARQTRDDAAAGAAKLLQTFYDVLASLIGPALCEQLLKSVREDEGLSVRRHQSRTYE